MSDAAALERLAWIEFSRAQDRTAEAREEYYRLLDAEHRAWVAYQNLRHPVADVTGEARHANPS